MLELRLQNNIPNREKVYVFYIPHLYVYVQCSSMKKIYVHVFGLLHGQQVSDMWLIQVKCI